VSREARRREGTDFELEVENRGHWVAGVGLDSSRTSYTSKARKKSSARCIQIRNTPSTSDLAAPAHTEPARLQGPLSVTPVAHNPTSPSCLHTSLSPPRPGLPYPAHLSSDSCPFSQSGNRLRAAFIWLSRQRGDLL
jgi:hypothetical protein